MTTKDKAYKVIKRFGPPLLLLLLVILFFPKLALMNDLPAAKDVVTFSYPYQSEFWRSLHQWSFPLWSRQANFPLFAESQGGFAHPLSLLLFTAFAPNVASNLMLLLHLYAALLFTYLFLRLLDKSRWAALLGAIVFGLSGFFLARMGIYTVITNGAYLPVLLFFIQKYHLDRRLKYLLFYAFAGALAILCGQFQIAVYSLILSGIYFVYLEIKRPWTAVPLLLGMAILVIGLSAIQTLPTYELLQHSQRGAGTAGDYSLWPPQLTQLLLPDLFGRSPHPVFLDIGQARANTYWGRSSFTESAFYVGIIPLILAIGAIARWKKPFWIIVLGISLLFALGSYTPLFHLYKHIPLLSLFRAPSRFLFMATAALAILSAEGLDVFLRSKRKSFLITAAVCFAVAIAVLGTVYFGVPFAKDRLYAIAEEKAEKWEDAAGGGYDSALEYYRGRANIFIERARDAANPLQPGNLFALGMIIAAGTLFFVGLRKEKLRPYLPIPLLLLAVGDLYFYARDLNPTVPHESIDTAPPAAEFIKGRDQGRVFSNGFDLDGQNELGMGLIHDNTQLNWNMEAFIPRTSLRDEAAYHYFSKLEETYLSEAEPGGNRKMKVVPPTLAPLTAFNVRYYIRLSPMVYPTAEIGKISEPYKIYINKYTMPRAYIQGNVKTIENTEEAIDYIFTGFFDPREEIVLDKAVTADDRVTPFNSTAEITRYEDNLVEIKTRSRYPAVLFLGDLYYPGWQATVDGRAVEILRGNGIGRAVELPPGRHTITFSYKPQSVKLGLIITAITLGLCLMLLITETQIYRAINEQKRDSNANPNTAV